MAHSTIVGDLSLSSPGPSNVVPYWVWYGFLVRTFIRTTKKVLCWGVWAECPSMRQGSTLEPELMVFVCGHRRDIPEEAGFRVQDLGLGFPCQADLGFRI